MHKSNDFDVIIIGGGIVGLSIALRSISQTIWHKVHQNAIYVSKHVFKNLSDEVIREVESGASASGGVAPLYLVWYLLQLYLLEELPPSVVTLGKAFKDYQEDSRGITVKLVDRNTKAEESYTCKLLVGADGINSTVRSQLFSHLSIPKLFHGKMMFRAVYDIASLAPSLSPPTGVACSYSGDAEGKLFAVRETSSGIATITAMANFHSDSAVLLDRPEERHQRWRDLFSNYPVPVTDLIAAIPCAALHEDRVEIIPVLEEWSAGCAILVGDAAHAMTPGLGQGTNIGLEDAVELSYHLQRLKLHHGDAFQALPSETIAQFLRDFWQSRRERVMRVHAMSLHSTEATKRNISSARSRQDAKIDRLPLNEEEKKTFYDDLYSWMPSAVFDDARSYEQCKL